MVKIILIRHGETDWNREQIFRGRIDISLNEVGLAQARAVQEALKDVPIDVVYASPLLRAFETARILSENRDCEVVKEEGVIDINFGKWQGLSHHRVKEEYKELYHTWLSKPHTVTFPDGESLTQVRERSVKALERVIKDHLGKTLAVVSHRVINKVLLCNGLGLELSRFWYIKQDTCAINMFELRDGNYYVTLLNDTCHLKRVHERSHVDF